MVMMMDEMEGHLQPGSNNKIFVTINLCFICYVLSRELSLGPARLRNDNLDDDMII